MSFKWYLIFSFMSIIWLHLNFFPTHKHNEQHKWPIPHIIISVNLRNQMCYSSLPGNRTHGIACRAQWLGVMRSQKHEFESRPGKNKSVPSCTNILFLISSRHIWPNAPYICSKTLQHDTLMNTKHIVADRGTIQTNSMKFGTPSTLLYASNKNTMDTNKAELSLGNIFTNKSGTEIITNRLYL